MPTHTKLARPHRFADLKINSVGYSRNRVRDGVLVITVSRNGTGRSLTDTAKVMDDELSSMQGLLEQEETELFEKFLSDEVRHEVSSRIYGARNQVERMNKLMDGHPTSSGLRFQLKWLPDDAAGMPAEVIEMLRKPKGTLYPSEREQLSGFFRARIGQVSAREFTLPWRQQLAELLDYRRWYRFVLYYKHHETDYAKLEGRRHSQMSGGEKAVALHLPLFAAAATHCEASRVAPDDAWDAPRPGCPRLILLDEVFAGVDQENRGALFDLIRSLDLDLIATSESEQGLYPQLDGLSIYHLVVDDAMPGVLAVRSVWDGKEEYSMLNHDLAELR